MGLTGGCPQVTGDRIQVPTTGRMTQPYGSRHRPQGLQHELVYGGSTGPQGAPPRPLALGDHILPLAQSVKARTAGPDSPQLAPRPCSEASLPQGKAAREGTGKIHVYRPPTSGIHFKGLYVFNVMALPPPPDVQGRGGCPLCPASPRPLHCLVGAGV